MQNVVIEKHWPVKGLCCKCAEVCNQVRNSQNSKFLGSQYSTITNLQIFSLCLFSNRKFIQNNAQLCTQKTVLKNDFLFWTNLNYSIICYICKEKKVCICRIAQAVSKKAWVLKLQIHNLQIRKLQKRLGLQIANTHSATFAEGPQT
jgi:hypothetical protein